MRIDRGRVDAVLANAAGFIAVVLFGPDAGLVRERASALTVRAAGAADDPFRIIDLPASASARLSAELASVPLTGGRRVVRIRDAGDAIAGALSEAVRQAAADGLAIIEAGDLGPRSRLRSLAEKEKVIAAIGCYPEEGQALTARVRQALQGAGISADARIVGFIADHLPTDSGARAQELAKLVQMAGPEAQLSLDLAAMSLGIDLEDRTDAAIGSALAGQLSAADAAIEESLLAGTSPVAMIRAALRQALMVQSMAASGDEPGSTAQAAQRAAPPMYRQDRKAIEEALRRWSAGELAQFTARLLQAERRLKSGEPEAAVVRHSLLSLAEPRRQSDRA